MRRWAKRRSNHQPGDDHHGCTDPRDPGPRDNSTILVYANGVAVLSPEESRLRTVWREKNGERRMHHVIEWDDVNSGARVEDAADSYDRRSAQSPDHRLPGLPGPG
jgi:hypothetical protein